MAKKATTIVRLVSTANTGYFKIAKRNFKKLTEKLERMCYDPKIRKHVKFVEKKDKK